MIWLGILIDAVPESMVIGFIVAECVHACLTSHLASHTNIVCLQLDSFRHLRATPPLPALFWRVLVTPLLSLCTRGCLH